MSRRDKPKSAFDRELATLPPDLRWRELMARVEAVIFAAAQPVPRATLAALVGNDGQLDQLIADIRAELAARPYELIEVAGGYQHRTRQRYADVIRASGLVPTPPLALAPLERLVLTAIGYFQPVTRQQVADLLGQPVSRDAIAVLRRAELIATGPRSPQPGAPFTYVTTPAFLRLWGLASLRDLPDMDRLEAAGLLGTPPRQDDLRRALGISGEGNEEEEEDAEALAESESEADDAWTPLED